MESNEIFKKVVNGQNLNQSEEKTLMSETVNTRKQVSDTCEKIISWSEISIQERLGIAKNLVAPNVSDILQREILVTSLSWEKSKISLKARYCTDSDENIRKFLVIMWAKNVKVHSDFPCGRAWENYEWVTYIEFNY